jgi:hypothetical protein
MKAVAVWTLGTVYVLAALVGMVAVVWAADHVDNSVDPTHWALGALVVLAPLGLYGAWLVGGAWIRARLAGSQRWFAVGVAVVVAVAAALAVGAHAVIADASECGDDDCVRFGVPVALAGLLGGWSLPSGLWTLRRLRYPVPLMSAALVAVSLTLVAGLAAVVQRTRQEDDYADLAIAAILLVWILPAVGAVVAMVVVRGPLGSAGHRTVAGQTAAGYLVGVGSWFIAMPFAAGVDSDALPVLLAVSGGPGAVLLVLGLAMLVYRARADEPR